MKEGCLSETNYTGHTAGHCFASKAGSFESRVGQADDALFQVPRGSPPGFALLLYNMRSAAQPENTIDKYFCPINAHFVCHLLLS